MIRETRDSTIAALKAEPGLAALRRSLDIYYGDSVRDAAMGSLYGRFIAAGDLGLDIGSHVGDRIASFRRLGARVVALEPQPDCARVIRAIHGSDQQAKLIEAACGASTSSRCRSLPALFQQIGQGSDLAGSRIDCRAVEGTIAPVACA